MCDKSQTARRGRRPGHTSGREHAGLEFSQPKSFLLTERGVSLPPAHWHSVHQWPSICCHWSPGKPWMPHSQNFLLFSCQAPMNNRLNVVWAAFSFTPSNGLWDAQASISMAQRSLSPSNAISVHLLLEAILCFWTEKKPILGLDSISRLICPDSKRPGSSLWDFLTLLSEAVAFSSLHLTLNRKKRWGLFWSKATCPEVSIRVSWSYTDLGLNPSFAIRLIPDPCLNSLSLSFLICEMGMIKEGLSKVTIRIKMDKEC